MSKQILFRSATLVSSQGEQKGDLWVKEGKIFAIGEDLLSAFQASAPEGQVLEAEGLLLVPAAVDVHTHMDLDVGIARAVDDFESGSRAALFGGTATLVDHMGFGPTGCSLAHQFEVYHALADGKTYCDYAFHGVLQDICEERVAELAPELDKGCPSFKLYMTYDKRLNDADVLKVLRMTQKLGILVCVHAENHDLVTHNKADFVKQGCLSPHYHPLSRPDFVEEEAVERILRLAHIANDAPIYIVHLSTQKGLEVALQARARGQKHIYLETCPQYLLLSDEVYDLPEPEALKYIMSPPLRKVEDQEALWAALGRGDIDVVATDHCPFRIGKEKLQGLGNFTKVPNGAPGVEERFLLMYSEGVVKGRLRPEQWISLCCSRPAELFGLGGRKGDLQIGYDADLVLLDPRQQTLISQSNRHSACDYTTYEGFLLQGQIQKVFLRGDLVVDGQRFLAKKGEGIFLKRQPCPELNA